MQHTSFISEKYDYTVRVFFNCLYSFFPLQEEEIGEDKS